MRVGEARTFQAESLADTNAPAHPQEANSALDIPCGLSCLLSCGWRGFMREIDLFMEHLPSFPPTLLWSATHLPFLFANSGSFSVAYSMGLE